MVAEDAAASARDTRDQTREGQDAVQAAEEPMQAKAIELIGRTKKTDASRANGDDGREELLGRLAELQSRESELETRLAAVNADNQTNQDTIASLMATISNNESAISQLGSNLQAARKDLDVANRKMKGLHWSKHTLEQGFTEEVGDLESKRSAAEGERAEFQDQLQEKDEENRVLGEDLAEVRVQIRELRSRLNESGSKLEEVAKTADAIESKNAILSQRVRAANDEYEDKEIQLEDMATENKRLLEKLVLEQGLVEKVADLESKLSAKEDQNKKNQDQLLEKDKENQALRKDLDEAQVENEKLQSQLSEVNSILEEATTTAGSMKSENVILSQQVQTANAKYVENARQLEEMTAKNKELLDKEQGSVEKVGDLESKLSAAEDEKTNLLDQLQGKDVDNRVLRKDFDEAQVRIGELQSQLIEASSNLKEVTGVADTMELENTILLQRVQTVNTKCDETARRLEEMAAENKQLLGKLALDEEFSEKVGDLESKLSAVEDDKAKLQDQLRGKDENNQALREDLEEAQVRIGELQSQLSESINKMQEIMGRTDIVTSENAILLQQVQTVNAKYGENARQLEEMAIENNQLLGKLELEEGFAEKAADFQSKLSTMEDVATELQDQLREKDKENLAFRKELGEAQAQNGELQSQLSEAGSFLKEATTTAGSMESENAILSQQVQTVHVKYEEKGRQLEELAVESNQLLGKLSDLESKLSAMENEKIELQDQLLEKDGEGQILRKDLEEAQVQIGELQSQLSKVNSLMQDATMTAGSMESENAILSQQAQTANAKYEEKERQLEELVMENSQLLSKLGFEQEFAKEISDLESKLSATEEEKKIIQNQLREKDEEDQTLRKDLDDARVQVGELQSQLSESNGFLQEVARTADTVKSENTNLLQEVRTLNAKCENNERQLGEMAMEHKHFLNNLEATETELQQQIQHVGSEAQRKEANLLTKYAAIIAEKEASDVELHQARSVISQAEARLSKLSTAEEGKAELLQTRLQEKDEENKALRNELGETKVQIAEVQSQLSKSNSFLDEATTTNKKIKAENADLLRQVEIVNTKCEEKSRQLEELVTENKQLVSKLESTEHDLQQNIKDVASEWQRKEDNLVAKCAAITAQKEALDMELHQIRSEYTGLQQQVQTANAKHEEKEVQLEEMAMENKQLLDKLESRENELQQKILNADSEMQQKEENLVAKCAAITAKKEASDKELHQARSEIADLLQQVVTMNAKYAENENQLNEVAKKNNQLLNKLESTEHDLQQNIKDVASEWQRKEDNLVAKCAAITAEKEASDMELHQIRSEYTDLQRQVQTANAKHEEKDVQLEEMAMENKQLLDKLESRENELQQKILNADSEMQQKEANLILKCAAITAKKEASDKELHQVRSEIADLLQQVETMNAKYKESERQLEESVTKNNQLLNKLESAKCEMQQKTQDVGPSEQQNEANLVTKCAVITAKRETSDEMLHQARLEVAELLQQVQAVNTRYEENKRQLEEMTITNKQLLNKLESTKPEFQQNTKAIESEVQLKNANLVAKCAVVTDNKEATDVELRRARSDIADLLQQVQTVNAKYEEIERQLEKMSRENKQLLDQLKSTEHELQQKTQDVESEVQRTETNLEITRAADKNIFHTRSEMAGLSQQDQTVNVKYGANGGQLEKMAMENNQLLDKLESTQHELQQKIQNVGSETQRTETNLVTKCAMITAEKEALDMELNQARAEIADLLHQVQTANAKYERNEKQLEKMAMSIKQLLKKLVSTEHQLQQKIQDAESEMQRKEASDIELQQARSKCVILFQQAQTVNSKYGETERKLNDMATENKQLLENFESTRHRLQHEIRDVGSELQGKEANLIPACAAITAKKEVSDKELQQARLENTGILDQVQAINASCEENERQLEIMPMENKQLLIKLESRDHGFDQKVQDEGFDVQQKGVNLVTKSAVITDAQEVLDMELHHTHSEIDVLLQQFHTMNAKYEENERQLEIMAIENKQLLKELDSFEHELQQKIQDVGSEIQQKEVTVVAKSAAITAEKEGSNMELQKDQLEIADLSQQVETMNAKYAGNERRRDEVTIENKQLLNKLDLTVHELQQKIHHPTMQSEEANLILKCAATTAKKEASDMELDQARSEIAGLLQQVETMNAKYEQNERQLETMAAEKKELFEELESREHELQQKIQDVGSELQPKESNLVTNSVDITVEHESSDIELHQAHSEIDVLLLQVQTMNVKNEENERQLEAMGVENKQLFDKLESREQKLQQKIQNIRSEMYQKEENLVATCAAITAEKEASDKELQEARAEIDALLHQVQTVNVKNEENERQLEAMAVENKQLFDKIESREHELQRKGQDVGSEARRNEANLLAKCAAFYAEKDASDMELRQARCVLSETQSRLSNLKEELTKPRQTTPALQSGKQASDPKLAELCGRLQALTYHLESARSAIAMLEAKLRVKDENCERLSSIEQKLVRENCTLNKIRRDLHNRVIQLSGNIRVFIRVRPLIESEHQTATRHCSSANHGRPSKGCLLPSSTSRGSPAPSSARPSRRGSTVTPSSRYASRSEDGAAECPFRFPSIDERNTTCTRVSSSPGNPPSPSFDCTPFNDMTRQTIVLTEPYKDRGGLNPRRKRWKYGFDRVFHQDNGQVDIWESAEPLVQSCIDGFRVCMFAYGQTGSGKTHTMIGNSENRGLIPRAVERLFAAKQEIESSPHEDVSVDIRVELLEIYNEDVRDLLGDNLKLNSSKAFCNVKANARDEKEVAGILQMVKERRCAEATNSNRESSRSHLLFIIHFDVASSCNDGAATRSGRLHVVDLAGSESLDESGSLDSALLAEAKHINKSLSTLALVVEKLQAKKSANEHIPYRDSKLTYLLRNSLGGDSKTLAIVCCSPHQAHFNESLNSLRFAAKMSKVEMKDTNTFECGWEY